MSILIGFLFHLEYPKALFWTNFTSLVCKWHRWKPLSYSYFNFADDHTIVRYTRSFEEHQVLQNDLDKIHLWILKSNLPLNASKCVIVYFSRSSGHILYDYNLGGFKDKVVNDFKLLGSVFNSFTTFSSQVDSVCKKFLNLSGFRIRISQCVTFLLFNIS